MTLNINQIRSETPTCKDKLFFNSAGSSLMPTAVSQIVHEYLHKEEAFGGYYVSDNHEDILKGFYTEAAKLLNCAPEEIAYTHDATESFSRALSSIDFKAGDCIVTSSLDYTSNQIQYLSLQKRFGIHIHRIGLTAEGNINSNEAETLIKEHRPRLVAITHIPTNSGTVQDVKAIGEICAHYEDVYYLVDACQSVGMIDVNVKELQCDFLSGTGRKFLRGPRGTGFLYVSDRVLQTEMSPLFVDGRSALWNEVNGYEVSPTARRFETWEASYAGKMGLMAAFQYANNIGIEAIQKYNNEISQALRSRLQTIRNIEVYDRGSQLSNIITIRKKSKSLTDMEKVLSEASVFYSVSTTEWGLIDFTEKGVDWVIRLSPHYFNTVEELDALCLILDGI